MSETVIIKSDPLMGQWRLIAPIFALVVTALVIFYVWFLKVDYAVLARDLRPEEAATIVAELKSQEVSVRLADEGTTILVPASRLDQSRLDLAAKELPLKGTVGFELFNESDMGITDFAQKVNYQRAIQGEIARTLMAMEGIASARVHVALPERSLFRAARSEPRAAVTVTPRPGATIGSDRVAGIQRLVAATVPDLAAERVAVLNERGELLTPSYADVMGAEASALERGYADQLRQAILGVRPALAFDVKVTAVDRSVVGGAGTASAMAAAGEPRRHVIRAILFTSMPLNQSDEQIIADAAAAALSLNLNAGDSFAFSITPQMAAPLPPVTSVSPAKPEPASPEALVDQMVNQWLIAVSLLAAVGLALGAFLWSRQRQRRRDELVGRIREQLRLTQSAVS